MIIWDVIMNGVHQFCLRRHSEFVVGVGVDGDGDGDGDVGVLCGCKQTIVDIWQNGLCSIGCWVLGIGHWAFQSSSLLLLLYR